MSGFIEQCEPDSSTMDFTLDSSTLSGAHRGDLNVPVTKIKVNLKNCLQQYKEKAHEHNKILESLECSACDLPKNTRKQFVNAFRDSDVFKYNGVGSKEMVMINPEHVMSSLSVDKKVADILRQKKQAEAAVAQMRNLDNTLSRTLKEDNEPEKQDLICYKRAQMVKYSVELDKYKQELQQLQQLPQVEMPQYTLEELKDFENEQDQLKVEIALVKSKLEKYCNLPLSQSNAARKLVELKQELKNLDNEIKMKLQN